MRLVDSHCHLNADAVRRRRGGGARARAGCRRRAVLVPGWNVASCERALELVDRFAWLDASVGVHPTTPRRSTTRAGGDRRAVAGPARRGDRRDRPRLRPGLLADPGPAREPAAEPRAGARDRQAGDHPRPLEGGRERRPGRDRRRAAARSGSGRSASIAAFGGDRPPAVIHSFSGSVDYARTGARPRPRDLDLRPRVQERARSRPPTSCPSCPPDRLLIETDSPFLSPPGAPRGRNEPEWVRITADWVAERRHDPVDRSGDALVGAYDRTFRARPR